MGEEAKQGLAESPRNGGRTEGRTGGGQEGGQGEERPLQVLYYRTGEETGEMEVVDRKESGNCLPASRSGVSTEDPNKANCGILTQENKVL